MAMEERLSAKIEKASEASREAAQQAKLNSESLEQIESRVDANEAYICLLYTSPSPRDRQKSRMPSSA